MADDWQTGDLALCVNAGRCPDYGGFFKAGRIYTVAYVVFVPGGWSRNFGKSPSGVGLEFEEMPLPVPADARRFRKIRPHQPDAEDVETIALLTTKPARVPQDA